MGDTFEGYLMASWLGEVGVRGVRVVAVLVADGDNSRRYNFCGPSCWGSTRHALRPPEQGSEPRWWWSERSQAIAPFGTRCDYCGQVVNGDAAALEAASA